jgi:hypothetical protein
MKKLTTLLATLAIAFTLSAPVFAKRHHPKKKEHKKAHVLHAKKKGATKGKKKGQ